MMHETDLPPADQATAARLRSYFDTESVRAEATAKALVAPAARRRARPLAMRFAPLGGGFAVVAVLAIALAVLPYRGGGVNGGGGASRSPLADSSSSFSPSPSSTAEPVVDASGVPVRIDGERVYRGSEIRVRMLQSGSFLVGGTIAQVMYDCMVGACPESGVWVLSAGTERAMGIPLLSAGDPWLPSAGMWPNGSIVLRVRAYDAACPWGDFCKNALLVEAAIAPR